MYRILCIFVAAGLLGACGAGDRIKNIGKAPDPTQIENPTEVEGYQPISMPMPTQSKEISQKNSLWASGRSTFFKDQRAGNVGDILTVLIDIKDEATIDNETSRKRTAGEDAGLDSLLGYEAKLDSILPSQVSNTDLVKLDSNSSSKGTGSIERDEKILLKMAALITQLLPNGNMVIHGRQEVVVNFEKRILQIDGVIRPEDVSTSNTISYEQIAEARIIYGGEGQLTDIQQPRYGQQLYDIIFPF